MDFFKYFDEPSTSGEQSTTDECSHENIIMENNLNGNYVIGTGEGNSIERMIKIVFDYFNLDFENNLDINPELLRKNEPKIIIDNPKKLMADTGWKPSINFQELVIRCIKFKIKN